METNTEKKHLKESDIKKAESLYDSIESIILNHYEEDVLLAYINKKPLIIDFELLEQKDPNLADKLLDDPETVLYFFNKAIKEVILQKSLESLLGFEKYDNYVRFKNIPKSRLVKISDLRVNHLHKLIKVRGIIKLASAVRPKLQEITYICPMCGEQVSVMQTGTKILEPKFCRNPSCRYEGKLDEGEKKQVNAEYLILEENPEEINSAQAQNVRVVLYDDLVAPDFQKAIQPGSKVEVIGVLQEIPITLKSGGTSVQYNIEINANNIIPIDQDFKDIKVTPEDEKQIINMATDPYIYDKLSNLIAPAIYGYDIIKKALVLQLFGGVRKKVRGGTFRRGDSHILLIGDPSVGKSAILKQIATLAPKARYVSGKAASGVGLTASVVKNEMLGEFALEAGAIALTNKGIVLIDEFDKMSEEDRSAMHEAMEQQTISINKANIQATLQAQTAILAAANPKHGRFDPRKSIVEQINISDTLLSRFDIIFILQDIPNNQRDNAIVDQTSYEGADDEIIEIEKKQQLIRKYIAYAHNIEPITTPEADAEIKKFYSDMRNCYEQQKKGKEKTIAVALRQLEAIRRLSEAAARMRLSHFIEVKDARIAIELIKYSLHQVGYDYETNQYNIDKVTAGSDTSQQSKEKIFENKLLAVFEQNKTISWSSIEKLAAEAEMSIQEANKVIDNLEEAGILFMLNSKKFQKI